LEHLIGTPPGVSTGHGLNITSIIMTTCWYLWWIRRLKTYGESVPPIKKCVFSILAMVANNAKADSAPIKPSNEMWCKPNEGFLNLNVDASFHIGGSWGSGSYY
jgi:hypothetical protein